MTASQAQEDPDLHAPGSKALWQRLIYAGNRCRSPESAAVIPQIAADLQMATPEYHFSEGTKKAPRK